MKTATVAGAGIGGPIAAIMLDRAGYQVTLHEQRSGPADFNSLHVLTLQEDTKQGLLDLGLSKRIFPFGETPFMQEISDGSRLRDSHTLPWPMPMATNVMWDDLHDALAARCTVTYGSRVNADPGTDVTVWADGVGSVGRNHRGQRERRAGRVGERHR